MTQEDLSPYGGKHFWLNTFWKEKQKDIKIILNLIGLRDWNFRPTSLLVTKGQLQYETVHFLNKIKIRDPKKYKELKILLSFDLYLLFVLFDSDTEEWEIITSRN